MGDVLQIVTSQVFKDQIKDFIRSCEGEEISMMDILCILEPIYGSDIYKDVISWVEQEYKISLKSSRE